MTTNALNLIAILFYVITWVLITKDILSCIRSTDYQSKPNKLYFICWAIALIAHISSKVTPLANSEELSSSFIALGSYVMWFISLILFISTLNRKIQALAVVILPFTVLSIILLMLNNTSTDKGIILNSGLGIHVLVSLIAYSTLMLAALQAVLLAMQNKFLHQRLKNKNQKQSNFFQTLPALEDMEYFLFHLISVGVILLSIGLFSGFYYLDNLFGSSVAHKTILSIISWLIFSALLLGRWKYGWRGKTAVRWTLIGFIVLALAFFGSKFIQEFIIDKEIAFLAPKEPKKPPPYFYEVSLVSERKPHPSSCCRSTPTLSRLQLGLAFLPTISFESYNLKTPFKLALTGKYH